MDNAHGGWRGWQGSELGVSDVGLSRRALRRGLGVLALGGVTALSACSKPEPTPNDAPKPAPVVEPAPPFVARAIELAKTCQVDEAIASVRCPGGELAALAQELVPGGAAKEAARASTWPATSRGLLELLKHEDARVRIVGAVLSSDAARAEHFDFGELEGASDARRWVELTTQLPPRLGRLVAPLALDLSVARGDLPFLFERFDRDPGLAASAYRTLMKRARLETFPRVRELAKSDASAVRLAAIEAPLHMDRWSEKDRATVCPWLVELTRDERELVAPRAAMSAARCGGALLDALVARLEASSRSHALELAWLLPVREVCHSREVGSSEHQKARVLEAVEALVRDGRLSAPERKASLETLAYCAPNTHTRALADQLVRTAPGDLRVAAGRVIERLDRRERAAAAPSSQGAAPAPGRSGE